MPRFAIKVEYDGTRYAGSQLQKDRPTIQGELEKALAQVEGGLLRCDFAGRTDAGVHARGQVAAFSTPGERDARTWMGALNGLLPDDIAVVAITPVGDRFDPRRDARRRWYRYNIVTRVARPALRRATSWHVASPLALDDMQQASSLLIGRHDFAPFCGALEEGRTTVRSIFKACWSERRDGLRFDVIGDAFLPQQVRRMVGALVRVGQGRMQLAEFEARLKEARLGSFEYVAPAHGLCLMDVSYEGIDFGSHDEDL